MGKGKESDAVSSIVKYLMFFFNFLFWVIAIAFIAVGTWAYIEKNRFDYGKVDDRGLDLYDIVFDLTIILMVLGCVIYILAFTGCLGALRENVCLLKFFSYVLGAIFLVEILLAILAFVFSTEVKTKVSDLLKNEGIERYRDDPDLRNFIDWIQITFNCCGVGGLGYKDWSLNQYFNCTSNNPSSERCAVPYSCCIKQNDVEEMLVNTMCGWGIQEKSYIEAQSKIYVTGCVEAILQLAEENLYIIGGVVIGLAIPQLFGIFFAMFLVKDIQKTKYMA